MLLPGYLTLINAFNRCRTPAVIKSTSKCFFRKYEPSILQIRFEGERGTSFTSDMAIDDIAVRSGPCCKIYLFFFPIIPQCFVIIQNAKHPSGETSCYLLEPHF